MAETQTQGPRRWYWRFRPRFSLRTLLLAVLLIGSAATLHHRWEPWYTVRVLGGHEGAVKRVEFSRDGEHILTYARGGDYDDFPPFRNNVTRTWNSDGVQLSTIHWGSDMGASGYDGARFSPDGRWVHVIYAHHGSRSNIFSVLTGTSLLRGQDEATQIEFSKRSEERRVGKECRRLCRSRWSPYH
jgi:WD40 repeat protein